MNDHMGAEQEPSVRTNRIAYIDGLRALAALAVFFYHGLDSGVFPPDSLAERLTQMGAHGVDLFFVLSGFCLAYPFLRRLRASGRFVFEPAAFLARRAVRIVPPYYWSIALFAVLFTALHVRSPGLSPLALVQQLLFLDRDQSYLNGAYWTLAIEARWYFLFPLLLFAYARAPRAFGVLGIASYALYYFTRFNAADFGTLPAFMLGIWAADLHLTRARVQRLAWAVCVPAAVFATLLEPPISKAYYAVEPIGVLAAFSFVVWTGSFEPLKRLFSARALVAIGIASYSLYLFHLPVMLYATIFLHWNALQGMLAAGLFCAAAFALFERPYLGGKLRSTVLGFVAPPLQRALAYLQVRAFAVDGAVHAIMSPAEIATESEGRVAVPAQLQAVPTAAP